MTTFLTDAKNSGTVPDIIAWHELGGSASIAGDVAAYRSLEASLGISPRPIAIEEYATTSEVGVPGPLAGYIAKFERAGVNNAELAFWNHYGTLGDTLTVHRRLTERRLLALHLVRRDERQHGHHGAPVAERARRRRGGQLLG